jgi:hypothetical protein
MISGFGLDGDGLPLGRTQTRRVGETSFAAVQFVAVHGGVVEEVDAGVPGGADQAPRIASSDMSAIRIRSRITFGACVSPRVMLFMGFSLLRLSVISGPGLRRGVGTGSTAGTATAGPVPDHHRCVMRRRGGPVLSWWSRCRGVWFGWLRGCGRSLRRCRRGDLPGGSSGLDRGALGGEVDEQQRVTGHHGILRHCGDFAERVGVGDHHRGDQ